MNINGRIAERMTGYFARCLSISASTSGENVAGSTPRSTGCDSGPIFTSCELILLLATDDTDGHESGTYPHKLSSCFGVLRVSLWPFTDQSLPGRYRSIR